MSFSTLDIICILICVVSGLIGYKRGAINTLISFGGFIASFAIAWIFSPVMAKWLISLGVFNGLMETINTEAVAQTLINVGTQDVAINSASLQAIVKGTQAMMDQSLSVMSDTIMFGIAQSISFLIILFGVSLLFWIAQIFFKGVSEIPLIGGINRLLGLLAGLVLGLCVFGIVLCGATVINTFTGGTANLPTYEESVLLQIGLPWIMNFLGIQ